MPRRNIERRREQQREYAANYYANNKQKQIAANAKRKRATMVWFREYKATLKCMKCGENHPACLDFHHKDPSEKDMALQKIMVSGRSKKRIMEEINKCDVLCANCHRKFHWEERLRAKEEISEAEQVM